LGDLQEVVHDRQRGEACLLGSSGDRGEPSASVCTPRELRDLQGEAHSRWCAQLTVSRRGRVRQQNRFDDCIRIGDHHHVEAIQGELGS